MSMTFQPVGDIKQSTALTVPFVVRAANGSGIGGLVDGDFTKEISKNGGAFAAMTVTISEDDAQIGVYFLTISATHSDTLGFLTITLTTGSSRPTVLQGRVVTNLSDDLATDISGVQSDTDNIQTRLPAALVGGKMDSDMTAISGDTTAADRLEALMDGVIIGQVNDSAATTTDFAADGFTETTDDHFIGRLITFITGNLSGQQTDITDYDATGGLQGEQQLTVTALTEAPANNDFFVIH